MMERDVELHQEVSVRNRLSERRGAGVTSGVLGVGMWVPKDTGERRVNRWSGSNGRNRGVHQGVHSGPP